MVWRMKMVVWRVKLVVYLVACLVDHSVLDLGGSCTWWFLYCTVVLVVSVVLVVLVGSVGLVISVAHMLVVPLNWWLNGP